MSDCTDEIAVEASRLSALVTSALGVGDVHQYKHHKSHVELLELINLAIIELDNRVKVLEL